MKLPQAFLCLDCDEVTSNACRCDACLSQALFPIHLWINRDLSPEKLQVKELERMVKL